MAATQKKLDYRNISNNWKRCMKHHHGVINAEDES
jgi:hypothetical protein